MHYSSRTETRMKKGVDDDISVFGCGHIQTTPALSDHRLASKPGRGFRPGLVRLRGPRFGKASWDRSKRGRRGWRWRRRWR